MLYLKQNLSNIVLMSLKDRLTNNFFGHVTWSYLFNFTNDMTKESTTTLINVVSGVSVVSQSGSNNLIIKIKDIQTGTPDFVNGEIKLYPKGYWSYEVYEQNSLTNLDITDSSIVAKIENGKAYVDDGTEEVQYTEHIDATNTTNYIYIK